MGSDTVWYRRRRAALQLVPLVEREGRAGDEDGHHSTRPADQLVVSQGSGAEPEGLGGLHDGNAAVQAGMQVSSSMPQLKLTA